MSAASQRSTGMACAITCRNGPFSTSMAGRRHVCRLGSRNAFQPSIIVSGCSTRSRTRCFTSGPFEKRRDAPQVSSPERALLEVLSEVGVRQPLKEAQELTESAYSLRADVLRELLQRCTNIKTVRLCLQLGREHSLPWAARLDPAHLPTGSDRPWVSRSAGGLLVLKP